MSTVKTANGIYWCNFHLHISHKAAKSMDKLIRQLCGELQPAVCLSRGVGAIWRPPKHSWMSDKPQKQATGKAVWASFSTNGYLAELLIIVYSYCLMVKSMSCCYVCGRQLFSNPVTIMASIMASNLWLRVIIVHRGSVREVSSLYYCYHQHDSYITSIVGLWHVS